MSDVVDASSSGVVHDGTSEVFSIDDVNTATAPVSPVAKSSGSRSSKGAGKRSPLPPPPRATPASSSGYPGVSWNKRMGAWLSFYYDSDTRRSRTFHPKYYDLDVEKARQAAIEFMKSIEKHPRCSLRKSRRDNKGNSSTGYVVPQGYDVDQQYLEIPGRSRKRGPASNLSGADFKTRNPKSPLSCPTTQTSMSDMYDIESLKRQFHIDSNLMDPCYLPNVSTVDSDYLAATGAILENNYLSGSFESQHDYDKTYQSPSTWLGAQKQYSSPDYYMDSQKYGMPFLEGDVVYPSPSPSTYPDSELIYSCSYGQAHPQLQPQQQQQPQQHQAYTENQDMNSQHMFVGNKYDGPMMNEDAEIRMLMQSIALSPSESIEGYRFNTYNYGDGTGNYANASPNYSNPCTTPLGSPYLSPFVQSVYNHSAEEDLNRTFGFQSLILANEAQQNQQAS